MARVMENARHKFGYVYSISSINRWINGAHKQDIGANAKMCYYAILD